MVALLAIAGLLVVSSPALAGHGEEEVTVTPDSDLVDGQTVVVSVTGYTAGRRVWVSQCTQNAESRDDCDESELTPMDIGLDGTASTEFTVIAGPVGNNNGTCDADNHCLIFVQEIPPIGDADRGSAPIFFAALDGDGDGDGDGAVDSDSDSDSDSDGTATTTTTTDTSGEDLPLTGGAPLFLLGVMILALAGARFGLHGASRRSEFI